MTSLQNFSNIHVTENHVLGGLSPRAGKPRSPLLCPSLKSVPPLYFADTESQTLTCPLPHLRKTLPKGGQALVSPIVPIFEKCSSFILQTQKAQL